MQFRLLMQVQSQDTLPQPWLENKDLHLRMSEIWLLRLFTLENSTVINYIVIKATAVHAYVTNVLPW